MGQPMSKGYLSQRLTAKAQDSLHNWAISLEPTLFTHVNIWNEKKLQTKSPGPVKGLHKWV